MSKKNDDNDIVTTVDNVAAKSKPVVEADPFWPAGIEPRHVKPGMVVAGFDTTAIDAWHCEKCGTTTNRSSIDARYCNDCYVTEVKNSAVAKATNSDWMEQSKASGLQLYERQPEESDKEWAVWMTYRNHYPMRLPTWSELAKECDLPVAQVTRAVQRWSFHVRIQAWARFADSTGQEQRLKEIKEMNDRQVVMSKKLQEKLMTAIETLDPNILRPNEIVNLLKASTDLERRITLAVPEHVSSEEIDTTKNAGKAVTKVEDLSDVMSFLQSTGALDNKTFGVEQVTTRFITKDSDR